MKLKTSMNRDTVLQLEQYLFQLCRLLEGDAYIKDTVSATQAKLYKEFCYIQISLDNIKSLIEPFTDDVKYVGWNIAEQDDEKNELKVYSFSCKEVIMKIFNMNKRQFDRAQVVSKDPKAGSRKAHDNWFFTEESSYMQTLELKGAYIGKSLLDHITLKNGKKA